MAFEGNECRECGRRIKPTGKRGRPAVRHAKCKALFEKREAKRKAEKAKENGKAAPAKAARKPAAKKTSTKTAAKSTKSKSTSGTATKTRKAPARKRRVATADE